MNAVDQEGDGAPKYGRRASSGRTAADQIQAGNDRFRAIVEGAIQGILIHRGFVPLFANSAFARILGYANPQEVMELRSLDPLLPVEERQRVRGLAEKRLNGKKVPEQYELQARCKDGSLIWIEMRPSVIDWEGERAIQVAVIDIDERKRAEAELRETQANLEREVEERTRILADEVAARRRTEESLRESEERFKALFDNSPQSLNLKDAEGRYLLVNRQWEIQHGVDGDAILGRTSGEVFGSETGERLDGIEQEVIATGETRTFESKVQMPDGRCRTRLITKFPVCDGRGQINGVGTAGIDISEREAMEKALRESEERFRTVLDNSPIFIHVKDAEGRYLLVNPVFERVHGLMARDVLGRTASEVFPRESAEVIDAADRETLATGKTTVFEVNFRLPDGTIRTQLATKFAIRDGSGAIARLGTFGIDITERKAMEKALRDSEEKLRAILDNASAAISLKDADGRFLLVNREFERRYDVREEDVWGKTVGMLFDAESESLIRANEKEVLESGETRSFELDVTTKGGGTQTKLITKFPVRDSDGAITRVGTISLDVTERKRMENALRQSEERFRALIDNSRAPINLKDREGRYLLVNREFERCFGVSAGEALGARSRDLVLPESATDIERREKFVRDSGRPLTEEVTIDHRKDGKPSVYQVVKFPIFGDRGEVEQIGTFATDITERKRAEEALKASEEWFRDFTESSSDWLWETDAEGRLTYLSERIADVLGIEPALLLGKRSEELAALDQEAAWHEVDEAIRNRRPIRDFRYALQVGDGKPTWVKISGRPRFSSAGAFLGYRGTGSNVTEETEARQREAQVTERFLTAIETVKVGMALFDDQDRMMVANQDYRAQFLTSDQWFEGISFETMLRIETDAGAYSESYGNKEEWISDRLNRHRDPTGPFEVTKSNGVVLQVQENLTSDGFILAVAHDITVSKTAQQALMVARDELEERVSERTRALEMEIVERQYAEKALQEANVELERRVEERTRHLREEIAERKKVEAQFLQAQKMEAVGQLAGGIAHDFNNLLTVIQGNLSWLSETVAVDGKASRLMAMALEAARRAGQLTHRMLAFSRRQDLRPEPVDLRQTLANMEPLIARALSEAVKLEINVADGHWPLLIDSNQLESAILNVALNARDAMTNGGTFSLNVENRLVESTGTARREDVKSGAYILLSMADTGIGMAPEVLDRVFDPFFTTKEVGKGSGLGLSMVFGFVSQSGGFIEIDSTPGEGTRVNLFLPRRGSDVDEEDRSPDDAATASLPDTTVLVVEDDPLVRGVAVEYLKIAGIKTLQAGDGQTAINILEKEGAIDIVLSDVVMPGGLSGLDLAEIVRQRWPRTDILLMSGYSYDEFDRHGINPDAIGLLRKPFTKQELMRKIQESVDSRAGN